MSFLIVAGQHYMGIGPGHPSADGGVSREVLGRPEVLPSDRQQTGGKDVSRNPDHGDVARRLHHGT
jgi:hypothetical protein